MKFKTQGKNETAHETKTKNKPEKSTYCTCTINKQENLTHMSGLWAQSPGGSLQEPIDWLYFSITALSLYPSPSFLSLKKINKSVKTYFSKRTELNKIENKNIFNVSLSTPMSMWLPIGALWSRKS